MSEHQPTPITYDDAKKQACPRCGSATFAQTEGTPVTMGGWYGNVYFQWVSNPSRPLAAQVRCGGCGYTVDIV